MAIIEPNYEETCIGLNTKFPAEIKSLIKINFLLILFLLPAIWSSIGVKREGRGKILGVSYSIKIKVTIGWIRN